jgi:hypothetical protein
MNKQNSITFVVLTTCTGVTTVRSPACQHLHEKRSGNCITTGYRLHDREAIKARFPAEPVLTFLVQAGYQAHQSPTQLTLAVVYPGIKQPGRQANHSPPYCANIKNEWSYHSNSYTSSWDSAYLSTRATPTRTFASTAVLRTEMTPGKRKYRDKNYR